MITPARCVQLGIRKELFTALYIDESDFHASFDHNERVWTIRWKWAMNDSPVQLRNKVAEFKMLDEIRVEYEQELQMWIMNGWLIPYPQEWLGLRKGLILLMAVVQPSKSNVLPVIDYRELNEHVDAFTADADVCTTKLRNVCMPESLWEFQTVLIRGKRYCLTRLEFGVNVTLLIMKSIIKTVGIRGVNDDGNIILC